MNRPVEILEVSSPDQLGQVRGLLRSSYQKELPPPYRFPDSEWQELPGAYSPPGGALVLAMVAGVSAGSVGLRTFPLPGACEMKRLYVAPAFRRDTWLRGSGGGAYANSRGSRVHGTRALMKSAVCRKSLVCPVESVKTPSSSGKNSHANHISATSVVQLRGTLVSSR